MAIKTFVGPCAVCKGFSNNLVNPCICPCGPTEDRAPPPVVSFAAARFDKVGDPAKHKPADALEAALEWVKNPENGPYNHVIICLGRTVEDGGSATKWFQAGDYQYHAQMGLLFETGQMIRGDG